MRKVRKIFVTIILSMFIVVMLSACSSNKNSDGYYNNIKWGASIEDLKNKLGDDITVSDDENSVLQTVNDFNNIKGVDAWVMYFFNDDKLSKISITTMNQDETDITDEDLNKQLYDNFVKSYGDPADSNSIEYKWNTEYSEITLTTTNSIKYEEIK